MSEKEYFSLKNRDFSSIARNREIYRAINQCEGNNPHLEARGDNEPCSGLPFGKRPPEKIKEQSDYVINLVLKYSSPF